MGKKIRTQVKSNNSPFIDDEMEIIQKPKGEITSYKKSLSQYTLTEKQQELLDIINKNSIIFIEGPGGCLTKENKIYIYIMKSKNKKHNIIYEENTDKNNFIG